MTHDGVFHPPAYGVCNKIAFKGKCTICRNLWGFTSRAEDSLGLCLMDMQRPDLALAHFEASIRCRENFPELYSQTLLTQLFIADCLSRQGKKAESKRIIAQVRAEITAPMSSLEDTTVKVLNKTADAIK